jgi:hypothetical protein
MKPAFFLLIYFYSIQIFAQEIHLNETWINLLHYKKTFSKYKSEISAPEFFIAINGQTDPTKEFNESIKNATNKDIYCRFPARFKWLSQNKLIPLPDYSKCESYNFFKKGVNAKSLSLIFAGFYPENPASSFGHLFLKLNQKLHADSDLLDYALNFSASTEEDGSILYAWKGLTGGYRGFYSLEKFYIKVNEYEDHESRDLWEFELDLTNEEVDFLVDHIYELINNSYTPYYFLTQNCSYQILKLLQIVRPKLRTQQFLNYHIPTADMRKIFKKIDIKAQPVYRPSPLVALNQSYAKLKTQEQKEFKQILKNREFPQSQELSADLLDSLNRYLVFKKFKYKQLEDADKKLLHQINIQLAKRDNIPTLTLKNDHHILTSHSESRIKFMVGSRDYSTFESLSLKPAFHDFMDNDEGLLKNSKLNVLNTELRFQNLDHQIKLWEINFIETKVLSDYNFFNPKRSWGTDFSYRHPLEYQCQFCDYLEFDLSRGLSQSFIKEKFTTYIFMHLNFKNALHQTNSKSFAYGNFEEIGLLYRPLKSLKLNSIFEIHHDYNVGKFTDFYKSIIKLNFNIYPNSSLDLSSAQIYSPGHPNFSKQGEHSISAMIFY